MQLCLYFFNIGALYYVRTIKRYKNSTKIFLLQDYGFLGNHKLLSVFTVLSERQTRDFKAVSEKN